MGSYDRHMTDINTTADQLHSVLTDLAGVLDSVGAGDADRPTPCTEFSVAQLRDHAVRWLAVATAGFADPDGKSPTAESLSIDGSASEVRTFADDLREAIAHGGATRPFFIGEASMPGEMALQMFLWEFQMHGWDLARATAAQWSPSEDGLRASLEFAPNILTEDFQGEGKSFGPAIAIAKDAPPLERLLALSGRDPDWTAP